MSAVLKPLSRYPQPSYGFAKRNGVLVGEEPDGQLTVLYRSPLKPEVFAELKRYLAAPLKLLTVRLTVCGGVSPVVKVPLVTGTLWRGPPLMLKPVLGS